ncbi:tetratricopeptide repeat protein [Aquisphaera giovannonii]|nr:tetratricopeptide repeat protein [Aquisphaera giovannonii]
MGGRNPYLTNAGLNRGFAGNRVGGGVYNRGYRGWNGVNGGAINRGWNGGAINRGWNGGAINRGWNGGWNRGWNGGWGRPGWGGAWNRGWNGGWNRGWGYGGWGGGWGYGGLGWGGLGYGGFGWGGLGFGGWGWGGWGYPGWGLGGFGLGLGLGSGLGWGLSSWLWGPSLYNWGYSSYVNPYYVNQPAVVVEQPVVYDYSQPLVPPATQPSQSVTEQESSLFDQARDAFKAGDYTGALSLADQGLKALPNDPSLHEFRALTLFALGRFDDAATAIYAVLSAGPGWDWPTLIGLYPSVDVYTQQLRTLEAAVRTNPTSAAERFLLAYHYLSQEHVDAAVQQLREVVRLEPRDTISGQLLQQLTKQAPGQGAGAAGPPPAAGPVEAVQAVPAGKEGKLEGNWTAQPNAETSITLSLAADGHFTWGVTSQGKHREFQGDRTYGSGILTLAQKGQDAQPPLVGHVVWKDEDHFQFKLMAGPPDDAGLNFSRTP